ncbi:hypothetical protein TNCV_4895601 [Trichonephila clavipes]|nr:hypothetical protein TNCV_4895601 [Trichonephila clavipes]
MEKRSLRATRAARAKRTNVSPKKNDSVLDERISEFQDLYALFIFKYDPRVKKRGVREARTGVSIETVIPRPKATKHIICGRLITRSTLLP